MKQTKTGMLIRCADEWDSLRGAFGDAVADVSKILIINLTIIFADKNMIIDGTGHTANGEHTHKKHLYRIQSIKYSFNSIHLLSLSTFWRKHININLFMQFASMPICMWRMCALCAMRFVPTVHSVSILITKK